MINKLMKKYLTNKSKFRNASIDIRTDGGYIVADGSCVYNIIPEKGKQQPLNKNTTEYIVLNNAPISHIPFSLIQFLTQVETKEEPIITTKNIDLQIKNEYLRPREYFNNQMVYIFTDNDIKHLLDKLPSEYINDTEKWFLITCSLKSLSLYEIWDNWSKSSSKYNKNKNYNLYWNKLIPKIDINHIVHILKSNKIDITVENIPAYKPVEQLTNIYGIKTRIFDNIYVSTDRDNNICSYEEFSKK
jgi:hypothetical protein